MAKIRFTNRGNDAFKKLYVEKKTFKIGLIAFGCVSGLLALATYRLYVLGEFTGILNEITTYCNLLLNLVKGLF